MCAMCIVHFLFPNFQSEQTAICFIFSRSYYGHIFLVFCREKRNDMNQMNE